tara:strand:- start:228 stop:341 length:114 start_codon:yes stop_codon:yes gene_type:complete
VEVLKKIRKRGIKIKANKGNSSNGDFNSTKLRLVNEL